MGSRIGEYGLSPDEIEQLRKGLDDPEKRIGDQERSCGPPTAILTAIVLFGFNSVPVSLDLGLSWRNWDLEGQSTLLR